MGDGLDALALRCIAAEDEVKRLAKRVTELEGHRNTWRRRAWHLEERIAEVHSFAMAREDLTYEDHGDEFKKIAQMIRDALPDPPATRHKSKANAAPSEGVAPTKGKGKATPSSSHGEPRSADALLVEAREAIVGLIWTIERDAFWPAEQAYAGLIKTAVAAARATLEKIRVATGGEDQ